MRVGSWEGGGRGSNWTISGTSAQAERMGSEKEDRQENIYNRGPLLRRKPERGKERGAGRREKEGGRRKRAVTLCRGGDTVGICDRDTLGLWAQYSES